MIDYDEYADRIRAVANVEIGSVLFVGEKLDADTGFQQRSLIEVYSTVLEPGVFNLLHMHVDDVNESITVDVVSIAGDVPQFSIKDFGLDSAGKPLRYKIIVKEDKVAAIMYNTGSRIEELTFVEHQFFPGDFGNSCTQLNSICGQQAEMWQDTFAASGFALLRLSGKGRRNGRRRRPSGGRARWSWRKSESVGRGVLRTCRGLLDWKFRRRRLCAARCLFATVAYFLN